MTTPTAQTITLLGLGDPWQLDSTLVDAWTVGWQDITQWTISGQSSMGTQHELQSVTAATLKLTLDNRDGRFSTWNSSSPYTPDNLSGSNGLIPQNSVAIYGIACGTNQLSVDDSSFASSIGTYTANINVSSLALSSGSMRINGTAAGNASAKSDLYNCVPSKQYTVSASFKSATSGGDPCGITVYFYNRNGAYISSATYATSAAPSSTFTRVQTTFTVPYDAVQFRVITVCNLSASSSYYYVDNVQLEFGSSASTWQLGGGPGVYPMYFGYVDSWIPIWDNPISQNITISCTDIFGMLNVCDMASSGIETLVLNDNPVAYYIFKDLPGSSSAADSSYRQLPSATFLGNDVNSALPSYTFGNPSILASDPYTSLIINDYVDGNGQSTPTVVNFPHANSNTDYSNGVFHFYTDTSNTTLNTTSWDVGTTFNITLGTGLPSQTPNNGVGMGLFLAGSSNVQYIYASIVSYNSSTKVANCTITSKPTSPGTSTSWNVYSSDFTVSFWVETGPPGTLSTTVSTSTILTYPSSNNSVIIANTEGFSPSGGVFTLDHTDSSSNVTYRYTLAYTGVSQSTGTLTGVRFISVPTGSTVTTSVNDLITPLNGGWTWFFQSTYESTSNPFLYIGVNTDGYVGVLSELWGWSTGPGTPNAQLVSKKPITDGIRHMVTVRLQNLGALSAPGTSGGGVVVSIEIDGVISAQTKAPNGGTFAPPLSSAVSSAYFQSNGLTLNLSQVAFYNYLVPTANTLNEYQIGAEGFTIGTADSRINAALQNQGVPTVLFELEAGISTLQPATSTLVGTMVLSYIQTVASSDQGYLWQDQTGVIQFKNRHWIFESGSPSSTPQAVFHNTAPSTGVYPYVVDQFTPGLDNLDLWNQIFVSTQAGPSYGNVSIPSGAVQLFQNLNSQKKYGKRTLNISGLLVNSDLEALYVAQWMGTMYNAPIARVRSIKSNSVINNGGNLTMQLSMGLYSQIQVIYDDQSGGGTFTQYSLIEGIEHNWDANQIETTFRLAPTALAPWFLLDSATQGKLNVNLLGY